ncbi:MAG: exopolyphosphatase, partial [Actinomycetota bacterium]|nr:exopolyphosphatase [Actinomycetota bacterium]
KGGDANVGVWVRSEKEWRWLRSALSTERLRKLLPEVADLPVMRTEFPNIWAVNFVVRGLLGRGAAENARQDSQAKTLAEWLRTRWLELPVSLLDSVDRKAR